MKVFFKKYLLLVLGLLLSSNGVSGSNPPPKGIPFQLINGLPYMEVMINGKGPFLFGFDTGFGAEIELDAELAATLNIVATGETTIGDGSGRNEMTLETATISSFKMGDHSLTNCMAILRTNARKNVPGMEKVKGIIGIGLFPAHKVTIDYPNQLFTVEKGGLPTPNNEDILDYETVGGGIPRIKLKVGDFHLNAVIDSRSMSGGFKIPQPIAEKLTFLAPPKLVGRGRTISNTIEINEVKIKEPISFGHLVFNEPIITYPSLNEDAIIGSKLLQKFSVTIDSKNRRIQFVKGIEPEKNKQLMEYAGTFGDRTITVEGNFLYIQRPNGMPLKMLPKSKDEFTLEAVPNAVLVFERNAGNTIQSIKVNKGDNQWEVAEKNKP